MIHASLFSGIGGFDIASDWMGWENVFHCENNKFCQQVLKYYWPKAKSYGDITTTDFTEWNGKIDIVSGGFPCQPYSQAGKRKGKEDDRHLWPEMLRAIRELQPAWVVGENVPGLLNWKRGMVLAEIKADLEAAGFEVFPPLILPACGKNAPHRRDRLWIIAHSNKERRNGNEYEVNTNKRDYALNDVGTNGYGRIDTYTGEKRLQGSKEIRNTGTERSGPGKQFTGLFRPEWQDFPTEQPVRNGNDGLSPKLVRETISAGGNAIVPQVAYEIFKAIEKSEETLNGCNKYLAHCKVY